MECGFRISETCRTGWEEMTPHVDAGIRKHRQEDFKLEIRDIDGNPVAGAFVRAVQKTHDFDFGCNCLWLGQCGRNNETYEARLADLFNIVTTTFCLNDIQPEPGTWRFEEGSGEIFRRPPADRVIRFAKKHGLRLKGQPLLAGSWYPQWAQDRNLSEVQIKSLYTDYFRRVAERYGDSFDLFDLVNEPLCHTQFPLYTEKLEYVEWAFKTAYPLFPRRVKLELNEATGWCFNEEAAGGKNPYYNLIRRLLDCGTSIDSIGFQFHLWEEIREVVAGKGRYTFERVEEQLRQFAALGIPLYITEITIPSCSRGECNEALQAEVLEHFYRLFFSIPEMRGILQWNLCDGRAWKQEGDSRGGVVDEFLRRKPAYLALEHLLNREWKTAFESVADESGNLEFRGFRGDYEITVEGGGLKRTFERDLIKETGSRLILV